MVGSEFIDYITKFKVTTYSGVEDFADKFNFLFTVVAIMLCTLVVTVKQYLLKPISCYIATEVGGSNLLNYVENYCWVQGTLPISYDGATPSDEAGWNKLEEEKILYYQWVPFVLGLQCILFYLPRLIWQTICFNRTGVDLEDLVNKCVNASKSKQSDREVVVDEMASIIELLLFQQHKKAFHREKIFYEPVRKRPKHFNKNYDAEELDDLNTNSQKPRLKSFYVPMISKYRGTYLVASYMLLKVLYLTNAIGQIFLMQHFLGFGRNSSPFGVEVLLNMLRGKDWQVTMIFPRVGFCFVQMKLMGVKTNGVTAQCALPVNMLNEKVYVFLWWWILLAASLTLVSLVTWLFRIFSHSHEADYIHRCIQFSDDVKAPSYKEARIFAKDFLRQDGLFLLRMIRLNAGEIVLVGVVKSLWKRHLQRITQLHPDPETDSQLPQLYPKMPALLSTPSGGAGAVNPVSMV